MSTGVTVVRCWQPPVQQAKGAQKTPGRNAPCWCGSGKKYKHCHMRQDMADDGRPAT